MEKWKEKSRVLTSKMILKEKDIYIDSDMTRKERYVQGIMLYTGKIEKKKKAIVKVQ